MSPLERRAVVVLAGVYALRILGLFLIMPVFALYAADLKGSTPFLIGLALGAYGLTQVLLQIPFGFASDRLGRKPVIVAGLLVFALGSVIAASSESMTGIVIGRAIQGAGAIPAVLMALVADLTREEQRAKAMAAIGITIGAAFVSSMVLSPLLDRWVGVPGIFWLIALFALIAVALVTLAVPTPVRPRGDGTTLAQFLQALRDPQLLSLNSGIFFLHLLLTALFVTLPLILVQAGLPAAEHWSVYLAVMLVAVATMVPAIIWTSRRRKMRLGLIGAVVVLLLAQVALAAGQHSLAVLVVALWLFFAGFNYLEASLPSLVSRLAPIESRGATMGVYSSLQFLGAFLGGALGGWAFQGYGATGVFVLSIGILLLWLGFALRMPEPKLLVTHLVKLEPESVREPDVLARRLGGLPGVAEAVVMAEAGVAYIRVDPAIFRRQVLEDVGLRI